MPFYEKARKILDSTAGEFVKFKVRHFVEITTIRHDKAVPPPLPPCLTA